MVAEGRVDIEVIQHQCFASDCWSSALQGQATGSWSEDRRCCLDACGSGKGSVWVLGSSHVDPFGDSVGMMKLHGAIILWNAHGTSTPFKGLQEDHCGGCLGFSSASVLSVLLFVLSSFFLIFVFSALKIAYAFGEGPWPCPLVAWLRLRRTEWAPKGARVGRWWTVGRGGATNIRWVGKVRLTRNVMKMTILSTSAAIILKWNVNYAFSEEIHSLS